MSIEERSGSTNEGDQAPRSAELLEAALGVAYSVARRHGGEVRVRSRDDGGGDLIELRFPIPGRQA
jgi:hypothetical protein